VLNLITDQSELMKQNHKREDQTTLLVVDNKAEIVGS